MFSSVSSKTAIFHIWLVRCFYPKRLTFSILWTIPTGAIWGEVSCPGTQLHADCSGVWTCAPLIRTPTLYPLRHAPAIPIIIHIYCIHIHTYICCRYALPIADRLTEFEMHFKKIPRLPKMSCLTIEVNIFKFHAGHNVRQPLWVSGRDTVPPLKQDGSTS